MAEGSSDLPIRRRCFARLSSLPLFTVTTCLSSTDIELAIYSNRVEIISPGKLPNGITPDRMRAGCRASRNQLLKELCGITVILNTWNGHTEEDNLGHAEAQPHGTRSR